MRVSKKSLRTQVLLRVAGVQILMLAALSALYLTNARDVIRAEQVAARQAARDLVLSTSASLIAEGEEALIARLNARLAPLRHVRMRFFEADALERPEIAEAPPAAPAPAWFVRLMAPAPKTVRIPIMNRGRTLGIVMVLGAPEGDIARVWAEMRWLLGLSLLALIGLTALLYTVIGRTLSPLTEMRGALKQLESGQLTTRVSQPDCPDLAPIARQLNRLAGSLDEAQSARQDLSRRLTDLQEAERKHIAMELHDEMGPCLFGLSAEADLLAQKADPALAPSARSIQSIVGQLRQINRRVLAALRPTAVGQLPLSDVLRDLIAERGAQQPEIAIDAQIGDLGTTPEALDLTLYRFLQEAMTNAFRHAQTDRIEIRVARDTDALHAEIRDFGIGPAAIRSGTGLRGMAERIAAHGGRLDITPAQGGGTRLSAQLPLAGTGGAA